MSEVRKRALFVLPHFAGGGAERAITRYAKILHDAGYETVAITLTDRKNFPPPDFLRHIVLPKVKRGLFHRRRTAGAMWDAIADLGGPDSFSIKMSSLPVADRIVAVLPECGFIFRLANDHFTEHLESRRIGLMSRRRRLKKLYGDKPLLCVSEAMEDAVRRLFKRSDRRIRTIYNPFDFEAIRTQSRDEDTAIPDDSYIIHVGRSAQAKRHDILLNAFKASGTDRKLVLLGKIKDHVTDQIGALGLTENVICIPYRSNPYPLIRNADALILSSEREGLPGVLIESLIVGTPVVSTDCPFGPSEILQGAQRAFLVPNKDVEALATAMQKIVSDPPPYQENCIEKFRDTHFLAEIEDFATSLEQTT
ncbi:glycosyltransferase [Notoacmeibacter sp. MSK16QG-6]|uniref:glycosyltransferase n=1 Tax=Notoacmeibacter sp. MSK16QG-6 TaxID=2957982 RepID=UPI00209D29D8|nr:glycosyltransferase [Notoacmeibacter sp. MSK16QG-6]MCP1199301.1 glycosyltransferase [Notoacmeibacter sp. MSK16QG-6]